MKRTRIMLALVASASCGGEPPPAIVKPPPLVITAKPPAPPPMRARWVFSHPERGLLAKLDLGDQGMLYSGANGRREIVKGDAPPVDAQTLALEDLTAILRDDKGQYAFVASDGDVYVSKDPLGSLDVVRPGPLDADPARPGASNTLISPTAGKSSILGIRPSDGRLMRSADYGATWKAVDYAGGSKPFGKAVSVGLDSKGNGLLLHLPQRVYVTHDDGATWAPIASPGIGGKRIRKDGAGVVYLEGWGYQHAKLDGGGLAITTDALAPLVPPSSPSSPPPVASSGNERTETRSLLAGDRVVEIAAVFRHGKNREIEVSSAKLGEKPEKAVPFTDLVGGSGLSRLVAAYGGDMLYGREDDDGDENAPTTTLFRSSDYGQNWQKESTIPGVEASERDLPLALGPKGWTYVTALCPHYQRGDKCAHRQVRPAGATAYEDVSADEEFSPSDFAFDETRGMVYALGNHEGHRYLYSSPLAQNKFTRTKLGDIAMATSGITVDAQGVVRVLVWEYSKAEWVLRRLGTDGKELPALYVPLPSGSLSLSGARGVLFAGHEKGWETADGGDTWIRVATNGWGAQLACSDAGCINGDAVRVGWDLPAVQAGDKVGASSEPQKTVTPTGSVAPPAPPPLELTCKPSGAASGVATFPSVDTVDNRPDARWATVKLDADGKRSIVIGGRSAVREVALLAAQPKPPAPKPGAGLTGVDPTVYRTGDRTLSDGVVTARFSYLQSTSGTYNPVDVDLAWWSAVTGRVGHHLLPKVKAFRVSSYGFSGTAHIVSGGLVYQTADSEAVMFIHDDGKVETLTIPGRSTIRNTQHIAKRWVVGDWDGGNAELGWSDDDGKTWKQKAWGLAEDGSTLFLTTTAGKATISVARGSSIPSLLFPVDTVVPDDPPTPVAVDQGASVDTPCDATQGTMRTTVSVPYDKRTVRATVEVGQGATKKSVVLTVTNRVIHDLPSGKMCTSAYQLTGYDSGSGFYDSETAYLYPEPKGGWSGWRFRHVPADPKDKTKPTMVGEPISCNGP